jgi:hypothetical protein
MRGRGGAGLDFGFGIEGAGAWRLACCLGRFGNAMLCSREGDSASVVTRRGPGSQLGLCLACEDTHLLETGQGLSGDFLDCNFDYRKLLDQMKGKAVHMSRPDSNQGLVDMVASESRELLVVMQDGGRPQWGIVAVTPKLNFQIELPK